MATRVEIQVNETKEPEVVAVTADGVFPVLVKYQAPTTRPMLRLFMGNTVYKITEDGRVQAVGRRDEYIHAPGGHVVKITVNG